MRRAVLLAALVAGLASLGPRRAAAAADDAPAATPTQPPPAPAASATLPADPASPTPTELVAKPPAQPAPPSEASPRRPVPDYAGRPGPPTTFGDVAIWVPRIVLSPVYLVSEFVIRRPLGALVTAAERANIPSFLYDFFAFGPDHKAGFAPLAFVDLGFNPSVGVLIFWNDAFFKGNDLSLHASTWGSDWLAGGFTEKIKFADKKTLTFAVNGYRRPDRVFYGLGPNTLQASQSRFGENYVDGTARLDVPLWRASKIRTALSLRAASFYDGYQDRDPSVSQQVRARVFALPPGFTDGYTAETSSVMIALDSRRPYPDVGSGVRLEASMANGNDLAQSAATGWLRTDAAAAGYLDLDGHRRVVSLGVESSIVDPLGPGSIPFTELVTLGGDSAPMPGFFVGRLVDRSAAVATLRYRWPIGPFLSGSMQAAVGNVFGVHLEDFDPRLFRLSAALGIESDQAPDAGIHLLLGFGTETFDHGGQVDSFRLAFGTSRF